MKYAGLEKTDTRIWIRNQISRIAEDSLIDEVMTTPKPGLVDDHDNGAHSDMDKDTFVLSARAIAPYIADIFLLGLEGNEGIDELFSAILPLGIEAEKAMYRVTKGVNTHKGAIFTMGILSAAAGYSLSHDLVSMDSYKKSTHEMRIHYILNLSAEMMKKPMAEAFDRMQHKVPQTHGEKLYVRYGEKGIRGEAELGFPIIKAVALPLFKSYMDQYRTSGMILNDSIQNSININVLLGIMTNLSDTCVLSRSDREGLAWIQYKASKVYDLGGAFTENGIKALCSWNQECIERNISPGGAADILSVTLFLWRLTAENKGKFLLFS